MRHLKSGRQLNRTASHRKAMLANLATSILEKERVTTTVTKAKEVRSTVERLITYGKKNTIHTIRLVAKKVNDKTIIRKLFNDIAPGYKDREGGYTRIIRKGFRKGDNAELAIIELVGRSGDTQRKRKKKKKSIPKPSSVPKTEKEKVAKKIKKDLKNVSLEEVKTEDISSVGVKTEDISSVGVKTEDASSVGAKTEDASSVGVKTEDSKESQSKSKENSKTD